jgi:hypothetical protein
MRLSTLVLGALSTIGCAPALVLGAPKFGYDASSRIISRSSPEQDSALTLVGRNDVSQKSIDLSKIFQEYSFEAVLYEKKGPYTFAFDAVNRRLFFSVPNTSAGLDYNCIVCINLDNQSEYQKYMKLYNFGPANVSFAVEPVGTQSRLWFDINPDENGRAQNLAAFMWKADGEIHNPSTDFIKVAPIEGATDYSSTYDPATKSLVIRYRLGGGYYMAAYKADRAAKNDFSDPLYNFHIPVVSTKSSTIRGYAALGQNLYILRGDAAAGTFPDTNSEIININTETRKISQGPSPAKVKVTSGGQLYNTMPQGLGVYYQADNKYQLMIGVAGGTASSRSAHLFSNGAYVS